MSSSANLESGLGRMMLKQILDKASCMIIFTEVLNLSEDCLASKILNGNKLIDACWFERIKKAREPAEEEPSSQQ